jgi:hypothetical protein
MVSWLEKLQRLTAESAKRNADPLREKVEATVRGMDAISTAALLDLIGLPASTGNARRVAKTMRAINFIPIKSRRLMPGGYRDTVTRGWAHPVRASEGQSGNKVGGSPLSNRTNDQTDRRKETYHV